MIDLPNQMNGIQILEPGGPDVLVPAVCDLPIITNSEVLIKVHAAGVNRPDCLQRAGLYVVPGDASALPGLEVSGEIVAKGTNAGEWAVGDKVVALTHGGGYAEYCSAEHSHCLPWPSGLSAEEAATLPETTFTVYHNLIDRGDLKIGETVLIHGGSSGIGSTAIQMAKAAGGKVIVTAGNAEKCDYCLKLGADFAIDYNVSDFVQAVRDIQDGSGVDVVLDMVAGSYVKKNIELLVPDGRYIMIAFLGGIKAEINFGQVLTKRLALKGSTLRPQSISQKAAIASQVLSHVWPLVATGKVVSNIYASFPLVDAHKAHRVMESSEHLGKIVLKVI
jgi:NADPH2:quinone reductase